MIPSVYAPGPFPNMAIRERAVKSSRLFPPYTATATHGILYTLVKMTWNNFHHCNFKNPDLI